MVSVHSGTIAWVWQACGSTDTPDAYQLRLGTASGVYSYCSCYATSVTATSLRSILSTAGTYYGVVMGSLNTSNVGTSTELMFTLTGKSISVQ